MRLGWAGAVMVAAGVVVTPPVYAAPAEPPPQPAITIPMAFPANDVAFDATRGVVWASVPASAGSPYGNAVVPVDPASGASGAPVFVGSEPGKIEISPDGTYLYVVLEGATAIRRVDLGSRTPDLQIAVGSPILDVDAMPGHPRTIAVVAQSDRTTIYDDGVARGATTLHGPTQVVFDPADPTRLYGYDTSSSAHRFYRMRVSAAGVAVDDETPFLLKGGGRELQMSGGLVSTGKEVIDPATLTLRSTPTDDFGGPPFVFDGPSMRMWGLRTGPGATPGPDLTLFDAATRQPLEVFRFDVAVAPAFASFRQPALAPAGPRRFAVVIAGTFVLVDVGWLRGANGEYTPLTPARVLDTRSGVGGASRLGPGATARVQIAGRGGVPETGVSAVVLNATGADPTAVTYLTIWPSGGARPEISSLNLAPGVTRANLVTVALGDGALDLYNADGDVDVLFDVVGYYSTSAGTPGSRYRPVAPQRAFDTRVGLGGVPAAAVGPGQTLEFNVTGSAGLPPTGVTAVILNVTVTDASDPSYLTVWPADAARPEASTVNFLAGRAVPNLAIVRVPPSGVVSFYNHSGEAHVIADVFGYYTTEVADESGRFVPFAPVRLVDTRVTGQSTCCNVFVRGSENQYPKFEELFGAYVLNVAVTEVTGDGYVTVFPYPAARPVVSNVNYVAGGSVANAVIVPTGPYMVLNKSSAELHYVVDAFGAFTR